MRYYSSPEYQLENEKNNLDYYNDEIDRINEVDEEKKAARAEELQTMISLSWVKSGVNEPTKSVAENLNNSQFLTQGIYIHIYAKKIALMSDFFIYLSSNLCKKLGEVIEIKYSL